MNLEADGRVRVERGADDGEWSEEPMTEEAQRKRQAVLDEHASRYRGETAETAVPDV